MIPVPLTDRQKAILEFLKHGRPTIQMLAMLFEVGNTVMWEDVQHLYQNELIVPSGIGPRNARRWRLK